MELNFLSFSLTPLLCSNQTLSVPNAFVNQCLLVPIAHYNKVFGLYRLTTRVITKSSKKRTLNLYRDYIKSRRDKIGSQSIS